MEVKMIVVFGIKRAFMKQLYLYGVSIIFLILFLVGCSKDRSLLSSGMNGSRVEMFPELEGSFKDEAIAKTLKYKIYYFRTQAKVTNPETEPSSQYYYIEDFETDWMDYSKFSKYIINITHDSLDTYDYRLVTIATPASQAEIEFFFPENLENKTLNNLSVRRTYNANQEPYPLSLHNYIGTGTITSSAIEMGKLPINFKRVVGQLVFDICRYDEHGNPLDVDMDFNSTLDRVCNITAEISNYTHSLSWDLLQSNVVNGTEVCSYNLSDVLMEDSYKIDWEKAETSLIISSLSFRGATRFWGPYLLATPLENNTMKVKLTFKYHDTYVPGGEQTTNSIELKLPSSGKTLPVQSNTFTRTTIKILQNRIIDVKEDLGGITIDPSFPQ